jgi:hypothetical protein
MSLTENSAENWLEGLGVLNRILFHDALDLPLVDFAQAQLVERAPLSCEVLPGHDDGSAVDSRSEIGSRTLDRGESAPIALDLNPAARLQLREL